MQRKTGKRNLLKRTLVMLLAMCMILSNDAALYTFAQDTETVSEENSKTAEEETTAETVQETVSDTSAAEETADDTSEETAEEAEADSDSDAAAASAEGSSGSEILLNYVAVESSYVEIGSTQTIVVSFENGEMIDAVTLYYHREDDGASYEAQAADSEDGAFSFTISYTSSDQAGVYVLDSVIYTSDDVSYEIVFSEIGIDAQYGVETETETDPDAVATDDEEDDDTDCELEITVSSIDEDGELVSESSIEEAIAAASEDTDEDDDEAEASAASTSAASSSSDSNVVVVLDPGHDSTHTGASANGLKEHELTLKIAEYCKAELEEYAGVTVYLTRDSDDCPYPDSSSNTECNAQRVAYAASVGADVYVAIHLNSATSTSANGVEIYYPNSNYNSTVGEEGEALAESILEELVALGLTNRGVKIRNSEDGTTYSDGSLADYYGVIKNSKQYGFPGIIIEHAFLTNSSDAAFLSSESNLKALGVADATGIANYFGLSKSSTVYQGVDYAAVYDYDYYIAKYADVYAAYGDDEAAVLKHFVTYGMSEGRQAIATFNVTSYRYKYQDLRLAYGTDLKKYYLHYINYGQYEGRTATGVTSLQNPVTTLNGVDYSAVYDYEYYLDKYSDLQAAYGDDDVSLLKHFINYGMSEGRQAISTFNVTSYRYKYRDLRLAYGTDLKKYYLHYINYGQYEGRVATGVTTLQNGITTYDGVDYSAVYNYEYYLNKYSDLAAKYTNDEEGLLKHFINYGMSEGRQAISTFDVTSYRYAYQDLRLAYGTDLKKYYLHYIKYGQNEGRTATGVTSLQNPVTTMDGVDYSAVYDYEYYLSKYSDLQAAYGDDDVSLLKHFINYGMKEGRQASASFNVQIYKSNYPDLQKAYGSNLKSYYLHYIKYGLNEGRNAVTSLIPIMNSPSATVAQMVAYFEDSGYTYPSYYSDTEAATITEFCQIYYDECVTEGVDPAVAFCQAMLETGWLQFGGDVDISQYNFCGMGATGDGESGNSFSSVTIGIRAHVQHLKAYASTEDLVNECVDPRFSYVTRGCVYYVDDLGNGYWASDSEYGTKLKAMVQTLYTY